MTRRIDIPNGPLIVVIEDEPDKKCDLCGKINDCRPYGPNDEMICFECGEKDPIQTEIKIQEHLFGEIVTREEMEEIIKRKKMRSN